MEDWKKIIRSQISYVYVINLDSRKDRWEKICQMLRDWDIGPESTDGETDGWWKRFSAKDLSGVDIEKSLDKRYYQYYTLPSNNRTYNTKYIRGATGCKMSHVSIITEAKKRGLKNVLILEDDACLSDGMSLKQFLMYLAGGLKELSRIKDWDLCYLGGKNTGSLTRLGRRLERINQIKTTHAFLVNSHCFSRIIREMLPSGVEADVYLTRIQPRLSFRFFPNLLTQREDYSDILQKRVCYRSIC